MKVVLFFSLFFLFIFLFFFRRMANFLSGHLSKNIQLASSDLKNSFVFLSEERIFFTMIFLFFLVFFVCLLFLNIWISVIVSFFFFFFFRYFSFYFLKKNRLKSFYRSLPDALLGLSNHMKAGLSLTQSFDLLILETQGPVAQEFSLVMNEIKVGVSLSDALDHLLGRMYLIDLELVIGAIKISKESGGPLSYVLRNISEVLRRKIQMQDKVYSLTSQGKMQGWVMMGLPVLLLFLLYQLEPQAMSYFFFSPIGWCAMSVCFILLFLGFLFIRRIVSIDI